SCTSVRHSVIMPEYKKSKPVKNASLAVAVDYHNLVIENASSIIDDFGEGVPTEIFEKMFDENITHNFRKFSYFGKIVSADYPDKTGMEPLQLKLNNEMHIKFDLPKDGMEFQFDSLKADFVLLIKDIYTRERYVHSAGYSNPTTGAFSGGSTSRYLDINCEYLIWDNSALQVVAYGKGRVSNQVFLQMNPNTWKNAVANLANFILNKTPFARKITPMSIH
ncbi:MAG: hypothetical protein KAR38_15735, partial [Calditrichia bacterium]|nr:hypothetical protein [Calditrichia bacterium]